MTLQEIIEFCSRRNKSVNTLMSEFELASDLSWDDLEHIQSQAISAMKELYQLKETLPESDSLHEVCNNYWNDILDITMRAKQVTEMKKIQEVKHLAVVHLHDQQDDYYLMAELENVLYSAASIYHNYMREGVGKLTLDSIALNFTDNVPINDVTFSILCNAMPHDQRIKESIEFDFEHCTLRICQSNDNEWRTYTLTDVSAAVAHAEEKRGVPVEHRRKLFAERLETMPNYQEDEDDGIKTNTQKTNDAEESQNELQTKQSTLESLLSTRWEDIHLMHKDVEIEVPHTIVELDKNTLTQAGREAWADVLNAKVVDIYDGYYGKQLELDGVKPSRVQDFAAMLAGYCSVEDYESWVNGNDDMPDQSIQLEQ